MIAFRSTHPFSSLLSFSLFFIYHYFFPRNACILTLLLSPLDYDWCMGQCLKFHANFIQTYILFHFIQYNLYFCCCCCCCWRRVVYGSDRNSNNNDNNNRFQWELISSIRDNLIVFFTLFNFYFFVYNWFCYVDFVFDYLHSFVWYIYRGVGWCWESFSRVKWLFSFTMSVPIFFFQFFRRRGRRRLRRRCRCSAAAVS